MYQGIYKIADVVVEICSRYPDVQKLCADYRWEGRPELTVTTGQQHIAFEKEKYLRECQVEGLSPCNMTEGILETTAVYRQITDYMMIHRSTFLFHGSAVAVDGQAYLFTATSGTGKSTHTRLWRQMLGDRAIMVNDDKPLIRITPEEVRIYGTPWDGKHHLSTNLSVPLKAICILQRGEENEIHPITSKEMLPMLLQQSHHPSSPAGYALYLSALDSLARQVKFYRLHCNMAPEAAEVSFRAMTEN